MRTLESNAIDPPDWADVYRVHAPRLSRYLHRLMPADLAADCVQDTFVRALASSKRPPTDELSPWLYRIATNLAIDRMRRARRIRFLPLRPWHRVGADPADRSDLVESALRSIPIDQAVTLVLRLQEGMTRGEIAVVTGLTERAVKDRLARGRVNFALAYRRSEGSTP